MVSTIFQYNFEIGRLSIVKELRGKARVIGITDYWTQILFKPLHDEIYSFLGNLPEDGTNDQLAPVKIVLENLNFDSKPSVDSLDLSSATDRLPVKLQADLLSSLGIPGDDWLQILNRPYSYNYKDGSCENFYYSVGQPMGAYSSFAMLALTNHFLVYLAAFQGGVKILPSKGVYGILGDDIVIANKTIASHYKYNMQDVLGVEVNPIKGFSGNLIEFAKVLYTLSGINLSPIGAKALLQTLRSPAFIPTLISDMKKKEYFKFYNLELKVLTNLLDHFNKKGMNQWAWLFGILGPQSGFWNLTKDNLDVKSMETLFREALNLMCLNLSSVNEVYYTKLTNGQFRVTWNFFINSIINVRKLLIFIRSPYVWTPKKLVALNMNIKYMAVLSSTTVVITMG